MNAELGVKIMVAQEENSSLTEVGDLSKTRGRGWGGVEVRQSE